MGLIKAVAGAVGGAFGDTWLEIVEPGSMDEFTFAVQGIPQKQNAGRGSNTSGSDNYISNGSKIRVPENTALIILDQGKIRDVALEAGEYTVDDKEAPSIFAGDGLIKSLVSESFKRFKFGGQPSKQAIAYFINLKEIRGLTYGTPGPITYKDFSLAPEGSTKAPVLRLVSRGRYSIRIIDPVLFVKNFLPAGVERYQANDDQATDQLFSEFITTFNATLNSLSKTVEIADLPAHGPELAKAMTEEKGKDGSWVERWGIEIVSVGVEAVEYDEESQKLMDQYNTGLMMQGNVGNAYAQTTIAKAALAAGESGGGAAMMGMGMGVGAMGGVMAGMQQPASPAPAAPAADPAAALQQAKSLLDQGLITQEQFDAKQQEILSRM
ncbi:SPFH domain-containing protein [Microgenomates group bacterium]|nr:SPFH domain-containing protein [Microgenomates group bacterium]